MTPEVETPPLHSKRVQAWVYAVLNPLIESLQRETYFLAKGNLTWQSDTKKCEYIRPIREYLAHSQWPNYKDFLTDSQNFEFAKKFEGHDSALFAAESSAGAFAEDLTQSDEFQTRVRDYLEEYQSLARNNPLYPYLDDTPSGSRARAVAALLVNRMDSLPDHWGTHKFWELYKNKFEIYRDRPSFQPVKESTEELKTVSHNLLIELETHQQLLCRKYDIPAAPIPTDKSHSFDAFIV